MAAIQARDWSRGRVIGPPRVSARRALTVTVTGLTRANDCSQPGMLSTGTKAEEANTSGNTQTNPAAWADSTSRTDRPMKAEIQEKASPNARARATAPTAGTKPAWKRNPTRVPTSSISRTTNRLRTVSDRVRPASTAERAIGQGDASLGGAEDHRLDKDPGHQEVDVVLDPRHLDGAAEHVGEQQHEHDRLDGREQQQGRDADVAVEVAPGHGGGVGEGPAQRAPGGGAGGHGGHALLLAGRRPRPRGGPPRPWSSPASASAT